MALHEQSVGATDEWYTPPHVFEALGCRFDMDVASPPLGAVATPWIPADRFLTADGLEQEWDGLIWMNPPFGGRNGLVPWLRKFFDHNNGMALVPDRTSAPWWQIFVPRASYVLFVAPKIKFIGADGAPGNSPAQGTTLLAAGLEASCALAKAQTAGLGCMFRPAFLHEEKHP